MKAYRPSLMLFATIGVVAITGAFPGLLVAQDFPNLAESSQLPQGKGLAAGFAEDVGIDSDPSVVFSENFESPGYQKRWAEVNDKDSTALKLVTQVGAEAPVGKNSLQVTADLKRNMGGGLTTWFKSADRVFIRCYVKFDERCDYIHHFCTLRANKAMRGGDAWSGFGGAGLKPDGTSRFSTALEPWGDWGKNDPPGKWNFYSYWHEMKPSPDRKYWGNSFKPNEQPTIEKGKWICAEFMLQHNTPGKPDGEQAYWIDGKLVGHWKGINWRTSENLWANAFTLESYVTDRWTKQQINIVWFDNVVIAHDYVGPAGM